MKTAFDLSGYNSLVGEIRIECETRPVVIIEMESGNSIGRLSGKKQLEQFAVNILKALKSKKLNNNGK